MNLQDLIFQDDVYKRSVDKSDKRWLDEDIDVIFSTIQEFISKSITDNKK